MFLLIPGRRNETPVLAFLLHERVGNDDESLAMGWVVQGLLMFLHGFSPDSVPEWPRVRRWRMYHANAEILLPNM